MTAIRVVLDGKAFIPQQPVSLPAQAEGMIFFARLDPAARQAADEAIRAYYQNGGDSDEEAWGT